MNDLILRVQCIMEIFLQAFLHIVYTSDKKIQFFKDKTMKKKMIWSHMSNTEAKKKEN